MMSSSVLDRIHRLMALSTSPCEEEARTAALIAVRLIREHRIRLSLRRPEPIRRSQAASPSTTTIPTTDPATQAFDEFCLREPTAKVTREQWDRERTVERDFWAWFDAQ